MATTSHSWTVGPAESTLVRWLLNLATGIFLGYGVLLAALIFGWSDGSPQVFIASILLAVVVVIIVARYAVAVRTSPTYWLFDAFSETIHPVEVGIATVVVIVAFFAAPGDIYSARIAIGLLWLVFTVLAMLTSSQGAVDTEAGTLTYTSVSQHEIPLPSVTALKTFTVGRRTYLWLSFRRTDGTPVDRLLLVPTDVWANVHSELEASVFTGDEPDGSTSSSRVELIAGLLVFGSLAGGLALIVYLSDGGIAGAIILPLIFFGIPVALFFIAYFSNLFAQVSSK